MQWSIHIFVKFQVLCLGQLIHFDDGLPFVQKSHESAWPFKKRHAAPKRIVTMWFGVRLIKMTGMQLRINGTTACLQKGWPFLCIAGACAKCASSLKPVFSKSAYLLAAINKNVRQDLKFYLCRHVLFYFFSYNNGDLLVSSKWQRYFAMSWSNHPPGQYFIKKLWI